jgi:hypothetical protein
MGIKVFRLSGGDLSSRESGKIERQKIEAFVRDGTAKVSYDLSNVDSMAESFADELFGVLVLRYGIKRVLSCIDLHGACDHVLLCVARVMQRRNESIKVDGGLKRQK